MIDDIPGNDSSEEMNETQSVQTETPIVTAEVNETPEFRDEGDYVLGGKTLGKYLVHTKAYTSGIAEGRWTAYLKIDLNEGVPAPFPYDDEHEDDEDEDVTRVVFEEGKEWDLFGIKQDPKGEQAKIIHGEILRLGFVEYRKSPQQLNILVENYTARYREY